MAENALVFSVLVPCTDACGPGVSDVILDCYDGPRHNDPFRH